MFSVYIVSYPSGKNNQDRVTTSINEESFIIALADGAGGFGDGAFVAQFFVDKAVEAFVDRVLINPSECASLLARVDRLLMAQGDLGESTAVIVVVEGNSIFGASVGDSGVLLIQDNASAIEVTEHQCRKPLIGTGGANPVAFGPISLEGTILVASDGLLKYASLEAITSIVSANNISDIPNKLIDLVRLKNNTLSDDTTVAVYNAVSRVTR